LRDARNWRQRQGDILYVGGDMMALAGLPKNGNGNKDKSAHLFNVDFNCTLHLLPYYLDVCVVL
jgi:hypothetical protein